LLLLLLLVTYPNIPKNARSKTHRVKQGQFYVITD
jgi:hypothetical protein